MSQCRHCVRPSNGADGLCATCRLDRETGLGLHDPVRQVPQAVLICEELGGDPARIAGLPAADRIGPFVTGSCSGEFGGAAEPLPDAGLLKSLRQEARDRQGKPQSLQYLVSKRAAPRSLPGEDLASLAARTRRRERWKRKREAADAAAQADNPAYAKEESTPMKHPRRRDAGNAENNQTWNGCTKSEACTREPGHVGLCNTRALLSGVAPAHPIERIEGLLSDTPAAVEPVVPQPSAAPTAVQCLAAAQLMSTGSVHTPDHVTRLLEFGLIMGLPAPRMVALELEGWLLFYPGRVVRVQAGDGRPVACQIVDAS